MPVNLRQRVDSGCRCYVSRSDRMSVPAFVSRMNYQGQRLMGTGSGAEADCDNGHLLDAGSGSK